MTNEDIEKRVLFYIYSAGFCDVYNQNIDIKTGFEGFYENVKNLVKEKRI